MFKKYLVLSVLLATVAGCTVNPVTGEREVRLVSDQRAIQMGAQQYSPSQQMQGGVLRADPELSAYVTRVGNRLAVASGVDLPYEFVVLNNSTPNAWALPGGKIAVNSGLLLMLRNEAELAAVLAHEVAHAAAGHGVQKYQRAIFSEGLMVLASVGMQAAGVQGANEVVGSARQGAQLLSLKHSRDAERQADYYGSEFMAKAGYDPYAAVSLQEQFLALAEGQAPSGSAVWFVSHPPSAERVQNNRQRASQLKSNGYAQGRFGQAEYAQAMAKLRRWEPAYELYDEAVVLIKENALGAATNSLNEAIRMHGAEAKFHGLRGGLRLRQGRVDDALTNLNRAIQRDPNYFEYYLTRGEAYSRKGDKARAKADLSKSMLLLPTSQGQKGFVALDIGDNPAKYVRITGQATENGSVVRVENTAGVDLADVLIQVELESNGSVQQYSFTVPTLGQTPVQRQVSGTVRRAYAVSAEVQ